MTRKHQKSFDFLSSFNYYLPSWGGMWAMLGLMLLGALLGNVVSLIFLNFVGGPDASSYAQLVAYPVQFIPPILYASAKSHREEMFEGLCVPVDNYRMGIDTDGKPMIAGWLIALMCAVATIACAVVTEPLVALLPEMPELLRNALESVTGGPLWCSLVTAAVFAPFFEEWMCRGIVMRGLLQHKSPAVAILGSAAFFALIHLNPWQAIPAFILGCVFGLVYYKTGSLKLTMLMHCANNSFAILMSNMPGVQDKDYLYQIIGDNLTYGVVYAASLALVVLFVVRVHALPKPENSAHATPLE